MLEVGKKPEWDELCDEMVLAHARASHVHYTCRMHASKSLVVLVDVVSQREWSIEIAQWPRQNVVLHSATLSGNPAPPKTQGVCACNMIDVWNIGHADTCPEKATATWRQSYG